jgi:hypothetical protein
MTHKILLGYAPQYLRDLFTTMGEVHSRTTRSHELYLQAPRGGKWIPEKSFTIMGYRSWNSLDAKLYDIKLTALFKKSLENNLLAGYTS